LEIRDLGLLSMPEPAMRVVVHCVAGVPNAKSCSDKSVKCILRDSLLAILS
jgi:hypothetical protein